MVNSFAVAACVSGLAVSLKKTEVLFQPRPETKHSQGSNMMMMDNILPLKQARLEYLKLQVISENFPIVWRVNTMLVWMLKFKSCILSLVLYGAEEWTSYNRHIKDLGTFHMCSLYNTYCMKWKDKLFDAKTLEKCHISNIQSMLMRIQSRWVGQAVQMKNDRIPNIHLWGQQTEGNSNKGGLVFKYKDKLK